MTAKKKEKKIISDKGLVSNSNRKENGDNLLEQIDSLESFNMLKYESKINPVFAPVCLTYKAYKRMVGYAIRYANDKVEKKNWKEVYGILIGSIKDENLVVVKNAIPICVGGRSGVELEPIHYVDLSQIDGSIYERAIENKNTDFIIGWWHTHPGYSFFFSEVDRTTHLGYQVPNPYAVGLIFGHCEKNKDSLGVAALRLIKPEKGEFSRFKIVKLQYDLEVKIINQKIKKVIEKVLKNIDRILKELNYIHDELMNKTFKQLQKNYGLILIPKEENFLPGSKVLETENKYVWDPDFFKKSYQIPKFREKIETQIKKYEEILNDLKKKNKSDILKDSLKKFKAKIKTTLAKPNDLYFKILKDFTKKIEIIMPYYDYFDTNERKIFENFEVQISEYYEILDNLNKKAELKFND